MALRSSLVVGTLFAGACVAGSETATPEIEWEGRWLRYGRAEGLELECRGVAPYMDDYLGALVDIFDVVPDGPVDFFYVDTASTPCEALGCVQGRAAFSLQPVQEHELVHLARASAGFSHLMLEEGAAEVWGDDSKSFDFRYDTAGEVLATAELATGEDFPDSAYGVAGRFHAMLHEDAPEATRMLLRSTSPGMSTESLSSAMEDATGLTLADWDERFGEYPVCEHARFRDPTAACETVQTVQRCDAGEDADIEVHVGCEDEDALGPRDGEIWTYRAIEIENAGAYSFFVLPNPEMLEGRVEIKQCVGGCDSILLEQPVPSSLTPGMTFDAVPGRYLLRFTVPEGEAGWFSVRIAGQCA
jgi:hypothetical protein